MLADRNRKNITAGLLSAFLGRNNDVDGYWAIGKICQAMIERHLPASDVEFDRSRGTAFCLDMELPRIAEFYRTHIARGIVAGVALKMRIFVSGPEEETFDNGREKYKVSAVVEFISNQRTYIMRGAVYCWSHDPLFEMRRWQAGASNQ